MKKNAKKICTFQKNVVILQRQTKKTTTQSQLVTQLKPKTIMKANELMNETQFVASGTINFLGTKCERQHYKFGMSMGRLFPTTRTQAIEFAKNGHFDLLTAADVRMIEELAKKNGLENTCEYQLTNSGKYAHLIRIDRFIAVLKKEFNF